MAEKAQGNKQPAQQNAEQAIDRDAFWLTDLYPDAKALFRHEQPKLADISDKCIVVLDANVLLFPFEMQSASVDEIEKVYTKLAGEKRLVIPAQAAREFYKNRSGKIAAIADVIDGVVERAKKQIFEKPIPLLEDDQDYVAAKTLAAEIINKGKEVVKKLSAVNERLKDEVGGDRVSTIYREILSDCVCEIDLGEDKRAAIVAEVARRAQLEIAPGFKDHGKEDGGIGDYVIWKTILQEASARGAHCIFVTEEKKPDWFVKRKGAFQPRPELLDEYRAETLGKSVHIIPLSALLSAFKASDEVVQEVQELEERNRYVVEVKRRKLVESPDALLTEDAKLFRHAQRQMKHAAERLFEIKSRINSARGRLRENEFSEEKTDREIAMLALQEKTAAAELRSAEEYLKTFGRRVDISDTIRNFLFTNYTLNDFNMGSDEEDSLGQ